LADKAIDKGIGIRPLKLSPVLPVVLCHENKCSAQNVLNVWREDVSVVNATEGVAINSQLGGKKPGVEGARAEPAAGSVDVEHASEYFRVEVGRAQGVVNISAGAEEGDEVNGRTSGVGEGELESDALQEFLWDRKERGEGGGHDWRRREGEGQEELVGGA
jgi:hypothetical protein